jgi:hypothetical protein
MQKEQFSRAYIQAVAARAGFAWSAPSVDDDSVDMVLHQTGGGGTVRSPKVELQVKCKAAQTPTGDRISYSLKLKNYDDLRYTDLLVPRILVVVLVPDNLCDWLDQNEARMALRRCAYWISIRGEPQLENATGRNINIPRAQRFTVESLQEIMQRIGRGGLP